MINPSASGWIDKFFAKLKDNPHINNSSREFYLCVRETGFIYGHVVTFNDLDDAETKGWTSEETTKAALLNTLYALYRLVNQKENKTDFINQAIAFYREMTPEGFNPLKMVLPAGGPSHQLEAILEQRIKTNDNIISRNFSHILTNALLFMDVLAFRQYLLYHELPEKYLRRLEETVMGIVAIALTEKTEKSYYDDLIIKLFESSVRYTKLSKINNGSITMPELDFAESELEKNYLLDMAGMAVWSDAVEEQTEIEFLYNLAGQLKLNRDIAKQSIESFNLFIEEYKNEIPYFKYSNPVKHFYGHAAKTVSLLITRNKKRLIKEISNNGELMLLLTHSTHRSLDEGEKKKVKKQLLEICKTVPSLTIFLLPGGSLLLPVLIKFIPKMLPTVFNENLDNE
ncbi:LETM1-related biofilm-associated protein [Flavobacterium sp. ST-75]|uniref:LETM1-related biofilm-associated protein n=1 Tax=Flavobacterium rhizophilum TaxID=3163296 RepID=A0ABW8Y9L3_9FLAO